MLMTPAVKHLALHQLMTLIGGATVGAAALTVPGAAAGTVIVAAVLLAARAPVGAAVEYVKIGAAVGVLLGTMLESNWEQQLHQQLWRDMGYELWQQYLWQ